MNDFSLKINTANILKAVGLLITIGALMWGLLEKFNASEIRDKELLSYIKVMEAKQNILMEERMGRMERTELWNRMNEVLKMQPSDESNYSLDKYMNPKEETKQASKE